MLNFTNDTGSGNDCRSLSNVTPHEALALIVPNEDNWKVRTATWYILFDFTLALYGLLFAALASAALIVLCKRHLTARFKVHTFVAIDISLLTLGVSRVLFLSLDPWGQNGYFTCRGCVIVSRLIASLAFPSLTSSYTLVFITLWFSARIQLGPLWIQKLKVLVPLCFMHYVVAIVLEVIGSFGLPSYPIVIILIACEAIFAVWGFLVCISFMIAGIRLLDTIKQSARTSSVVCRDSPNLTRHDLVVKKESPALRYRSKTYYKSKAQEKHRRAVRKIARITYMTASLAMLYSFIIITNLILICLNLFDDCTGYIGDEKPHPEVWLVLQILVLTLELLLGALLTYSIADYRPVIRFLRQILHCGKRTSASETQRQVTENPISKMTDTPVAHNCVTEVNTACAQDDEFSTVLHPL